MLYRARQMLNIVQWTYIVAKFVREIIVNGRSRRMHSNSTRSRGPKSDNTTWVKILVATSCRHRAMMPALKKHFLHSEDF